MGKPNRKKFVKSHRSNLSKYKYSEEQSPPLLGSSENSIDRNVWLAHWQRLNQPWRTEPEIDAERQAYLAKCYTTAPDIIQGIYPFKDVRLSRADIEWLLATYGNESVGWSDELQLRGKGLDLRGADLRQADL